MPWTTFGSKIMKIFKAACPLRVWTTTASFCSALLAAVVYIYGWRSSGASFLTLSPVFAYVFASILHVLCYGALGPSPVAYRLRQVAGLLQTYYFIIPIFEPRSRVCRLPFTRYLQYTVVTLSSMNVEALSVNLRAPSWPGF